jgi:hypothetical protein
MEFTETGPLVAPAGTVVEIVVALDVVTVAAVPLKLTVFPHDVLKPVPKIVTLVPMEPLFGDTESIVMPEGCDVVTTSRMLSSES